MISSNHTGAYAVTSLSSFELPHQLRKANTTISVYDLNGRNLGIFRDGITKLMKNGTE